MLWSKTALPTLWIEFTEACIQRLTPFVHFISTARVIINNENMMNKKNIQRKQNTLTKC